VQGATVHVVSGDSGPDLINDDSTPPFRVDDIGVMSIELDGELVLSLAAGNDGGARNSHLLDRTASIIWKCVDGRTPISTLARDVAQIADADPDIVVSDLVALFRNLGEAGVLRGVGEQER